MHRHITTIIIVIFSVLIAGPVRAESVALVADRIIDGNSRAAITGSAIIVDGETIIDIVDVDVDVDDIEDGKSADIIAVPGNPLEDIRALENVSFVMQGGRIVKTPGDAEPLPGTLAE